MDLPLETIELSLIGRGLQKRKLTGEPYLEVGCGDGFNLEKLSHMGMVGVGIDASAEAIESVRAKRLTGVQLIGDDFLTYDQYPIKVKVIFMLNVLEHIQEDVRFIQRAGELLPSGGFLVIAVPARSRAYGFADANAGHVRRYDEADLRGKLEQAGFSVDEWLGVGFPVNRTYTWIFNFLNRNRLRTPVENQTSVSGIRNRKGYYGGIYDLAAKMAFPILKLVIQIDRLFIRTRLGNNFVVFARKP